MKKRFTSKGNDLGDDRTPATTTEGRARRRGPTSGAQSLIGEALVLVVCCIFWLQTRKFEQPDAEGLGPAFLPRLLIVLLVLCVLLRVVQTLWPASLARNRLPEAQAAANDETTEDSETGDGVETGEEQYTVSKRHVLQGIALAVGYVLAATYLGYPLATFLLVLTFVWTGSRFTWTAASVAFGVALAFPYLFVKVVFIDLPTGVGVFDDFTIWLYGLLGIY